MRRRAFLKSLCAVPLAPLAFVGGKAKKQPAVRHRAMFTVFKSRLAIGFNKGIVWSQPSEIDKWREGNGIELPTTDTFKTFYMCQDRLFWIGEREVWEIVYTGDSDLPFRVQYGGSVALNKCLHTGRVMCFNS